MLLSVNDMSMEEELTDIFTTGTGFGSTPAASSPFGQPRPAFGAPATTSSGGLFGGGTATAGTSSGFGGFGANNSNNTSAGGLFGQPAQKPAFGGANTGGGLFGGGNASGGFGQPNNQTTNSFSAPNIGQNNAECQGTGSTPFTAFTEKEGTTGNVTNHFQSVSLMLPYRNFSFEVSSPI